METEIPKEVWQRAGRIKLVIFDVDGVLTDGGLIFDHEGREHKVFNSKDGHGMKMLMDNGVEIGIITARSSVSVSRRMEGLGITYLYQGQQNKVPAYQDLLGQLSLTPDEVAYVGDDVVDLPIMCQIGLPIAVSDAHPLVLKESVWQTLQPGGKGAARDVCELILGAKGKLNEIWASYIRNH